MSVPPGCRSRMLVFRAAGFIATRTLGESPGVRMSWSAKWSWKPDTPASDPAGARISAGKSGRVARSFPRTAVALVNRSPVICIPSPESAAKRMTTCSISWTDFATSFPLALFQTESGTGPRCPGRDTASIAADPRDSVRPAHAPGELRDGMHPPAERRRPQCMRDGSTKLDVRLCRPQPLERRHPWGAERRFPDDVRSEGRHRRTAFQRAGHLEHQCGAHALFADAAVADAAAVAKAHVQCFERLRAARDGLHLVLPRHNRVVLDLNCFRGPQRIEHRMGAPRGHGKFMPAARDVEAPDRRAESQRGRRDERSPLRDSAARRPR